ncbi:MAG: DNA repair protein [Sphingobacteriia bacterium 24-36-13]|jgi:DNA repair protein RadC|uniref:JAB domain-containing protein n=1 Tax=Chitinophagaceae TaxID=563835 RepID=UPI000BD0D74B|nr:MULTISPECIES: JAB domain-containing protein [Chitinophagaceae]OYZ55352.1 MAG: DNA repair protein [Sphingobacteriia bacterium 24-36-13]OZA66312.1 MAG: DNA repair protein [Sphingobacteriia bacterium 39-36-14]RWZ89466.1 MAG: DNA repair protein [Hydrotalea sp. AMD]HQS22892.1 JAB domain-containing protein [Sediminibacterium sp.]HQS33931.1 JAB domain-containing protein [Sediminibacterium sp.]
MESVMSVSEMYNVAEIELVYKTKIKASQRPKVTSSKEVYNVLLQSWDENKIEFVEQFKILLLNRCGRILGIVEVSTGGIAGTVADPKVIFSAALKANASSLILAHNHPSGNIKPSEADKYLTRKIKEVGKLLDISVLDHIIVTTEGYCSLADEGEM